MVGHSAPAQETQDRRNTKIHLNEVKVTTNCEQNRSGNSPVQASLNWMGICTDFPFILMKLVQETFPVNCALCLLRQLKMTTCYLETKSQLKVKFSSTPKVLQYLTLSKDKVYLQNNQGYLILWSWKKCEVLYKHLSQEHLYIFIFLTQFWTYSIKVYAIYIHPNFI